MIRRLVILLAALASCRESEGVDLHPLGPAPEVVAPEPHLRRLTRDQYEVAVADLLGPGLVMPTSLEPDTPIEGKLAIGAATTSVSAWGAERYEDGAWLLAEQAFADAGWVADHVPCAVASLDRACAEAFVTDLGRFAYRRPLTAAEVGRLADVVDAVAAASGDPSLGLAYGLSAILQSPYFLYRVELGEPDPARPGQRRLTDWEAATRLSFLLWNAPPDAELLDAVAAGELATAAGLEAQAHRLMDHERFRDGTRALFDDVFELYAMHEVEKDPLVFTHASPDLGDSAREETLRLIADVVVDRDGDFRDLMTTRDTFVDQRLAALYEIPAPTPEGFGPVRLPDDGRRHGLLGHASLLGLHAHSGSSSSTLRGVFVRQTLLCQPIPPPPTGLNTSIPEADADSPTLRERMASHMEDPACATCHGVLDPIGLGLENFDGIGRWRESENGATIDPSGTLDGVAFADAWDLGEKVRADEKFVPCWATHLHELATAQPANPDTDLLIAWYADAFARADHSWRSLVLAMVTSPTFRQVGEVEP